MTQDRAFKYNSPSLPGLLTHTTNGLLDISSLEYQVDHPHPHDLTPPLILLPTLKPMLLTPYPSILSTTPTLSS